MTQTVVHLSDSHECGGTEEVMLQLMAGLNPERWRSVLLHQPTPGVAPLVERTRALGVERIATTSAAGIKGLVRVPELVRQFRSMRPAIVHAHLTDPLSCKFGLIAASLARVPAVVATAQLFMELPQARALAVQHRIVAFGVDRYIAVSNDAASKLRLRLAVPQRKLTVVHNGIQLERFGHATNARLRQELTGGTDQPIVLTVARLDPQKGHRSLLDAIVEVPGVLFLLAGGGAERASLERDARALGIADRVRFLGHRDDVPSLLASCDLFVLSSLYEGLPLAILEAMAAGKPVVATAIGGTDEAVIDGETGILVRPGDPAALAAAIRRLIGNETLRSALGAAGRARVSACFSSEAMVAGVTAVYEELLK